MDLFAYVDRTEPNSPTFPIPKTISTRFSDDDDPPSPTSRPPSSEDPATRSLSDLKALGRIVYQEVWDEFYDWEPGYCTGTLDTLKQWSFVLPMPRDQASRVAQVMVTRLLDQHVHTPETKGAGTDAMTMHVTSFSHRHTGGKAASGLKNATTIQLSMPVITIDPYPPHPIYESCTPISRSVLYRNDLEYTLPFLPYADDPRFPAQAYQTKFEVLEWEVLFDPDVEMIQIEAVRRLHAVHDVAPGDIDRMGIFKELRKGNNTGLLWEQFQRDQLHWPGAFKFDKIGDKSLPLTHTPDAYNLRRRLMSNLAVFCPNLNCLHAACPTHGTNKDRNNGPTYDGGKYISTHASTDIPEKKPRLTGQYMVLCEGDPCGPDCFRYIQDFEMFIDTLPPSPARSHNLDTLETILDIDPDLFPCHLAVICLRPCKQVFAQRLQLFPDHTILTDDPSGDPLTDLDSGRENNYPARRKKKEKLRFVDEKSILCYALLDACSHPGECTSKICPCYTGKQHCKLTCRCGMKCVRKWKGCNCINGKCASPQCDCAKNGRECIPGICNNCDAGGSLGTPCNNTRMQRLDSKPIEIKCGTYGLGAFACQNMDTGTYIGTYTGQILRDEAVEPLVHLAKHISLNYLFEMPPEKNACLPTFNAAYLGNSTRCLNHMSRNKANVEASYKVVNGEHQIGFFTTKTVKAGAELFVDYGDSYWG